MISVIHHRKWGIYATVVGVLLLVVGGLLLTAPKIFADGVGSGTSPGSGSGSGYYTDHGYGWRLYDATTTSSPVTAMSTGSWTDVHNACNNVGSVYMFVILNSSGATKEYALDYDYGTNVGFFQPTGGNPNTIYFNGHGTNGVYYNAHYVGDTPEHTVNLRFNSVNNPTLNPHGLVYGKNLGWFCYSNNPPWTISVSSDVDKKVATPGQTITWTHTVINNGASKTNKDISWHYQNSGDWGNSSGPTATISSGKSASTIATTTSTYVARASDFGKKLCRSTVASPRSNVDSSAIDSATTDANDCVTVVRQPKVDILGGDLFVGNTFDGLNSPSKPSNIMTSLSKALVLNPATGNPVVDGTGQPIQYLFGSWVEYGIFASGTTNVPNSGTGTGSGSAFAGKGLANATQCDYAKLTFVNATTSQPSKTCNNNSVIGGYSTGQSIPNIAADFPVITAAGPGKTPVYNDGTTNPQGLYTSSNHGSPVVSDPITISAKTLTRGEWAVINAPNADVTITGDITYTDGPYQTIYDIPQLVIIAKNIYINPNVKNVDAWLIAQGTTKSGTGILDTCRISSDYTTSLTAGVCNLPLEVNGPVMSQQLWLRRTYGLDTDDGTAGAPAETFNLRPDAYLWSFARASSTGQIHTGYSQELPPRF